METKRASQTKELQTKDTQLTDTDLEQISGGFNPQPEPPRNLTNVNAARPVTRGRWGRVGR